MNDVSASPAELIELDLDSPAAGGTTVARLDGRVVFVTGGIPGERVRARLTQERSYLLRADVVEVLEPSADRVPDRRDSMNAAGVGGMEYAHVELGRSRMLKEQAAADQFERIGRLQVSPRLHAAPLEAAGGDGTQWRTRVQLAVASDGTVGMRGPRSHAVLPVGRLPLAAPELDALGLHRLRLRGLHRLELASASGGGAVVAHGRLDRPARTAILAALTAAPGDWSLLHRPGGAPRNRGGRAAGALRLVAGSGEILQRVGDRERGFRLRGDGFWQVHIDAAEVLSKRVVELTGGARNVLDLYSGAGLLSVMIGAAHGVPVHGIEGSADAVEAARRNAQGLEAEFSVARIEQLQALPEADTVVLDPPRSGVGGVTTALLAASPAERIVYVSCDGGTFARDARALVAAGFSVESTEAHDLFPLTAHTEFVTVLTR